MILCEKKKEKKLYTSELFNKFSEIAQNTYIHKTYICRHFLSMIILKLIKIAFNFLKFINGITTVIDNSKKEYLLNFYSLYHFEDTETYCIKKFKILNRNNNNKAIILMKKKLRTRKYLCLCNFLKKEWRNEINSKLF